MQTNRSVEGRFGWWLREHLTIRLVLTPLTASPILILFYFYWDVLWIASDYNGRSHSWQLWAAMIAPAVFATAYLRHTTDRLRSARLPLALFLVGTGFLLVTGAAVYNEWQLHVYTREDEGFIGLLRWGATVAALSVPVAVGATLLHRRLMMTLAGMLLAQALFIALTLVFSEELYDFPQPCEDGTEAVGGTSAPAGSANMPYATLEAPDEQGDTDSIQVTHGTAILCAVRSAPLDHGFIPTGEGLVLALGAAGAIALIVAGVLLRRRVPLYVTLPAALMFMQAAFFYLDPPTTDFGR